MFCQMCTLAPACRHYVEHDFNCLWPLCNVSETLSRIFQVRLLSCRNFTLNTTSTCYFFVVLNTSSQNGGHNQLRTVLLFSALCQCLASNLAVRGALQEHEEAVGNDPGKCPLYSLQ